MHQSTNLNKSNEDNLVTKLVTLLYLAHCSLNFIVNRERNPEVSGTKNIHVSNSFEQYLVCSVSLSKSCVSTLI